MFQDYESNARQDNDIKELSAWFHSLDKKVAKLDSKVGWLLALMVGQGIFKFFGIESFGPSVTKACEVVGKLC